MLGTRGSHQHERKHRAYSLEDITAAHIPSPWWALSSPKWRTSNAYWPEAACRNVQ